ncbi:hypothetical protein PoB_005568000 [Plakobranchus ocellatus]|uniref:Uncharacterized protein n=1 Tax=Plakobranchus ocellatus TaxID=259542 RepID=A0AAV4CCN2_9GAST|nr:hypothetical protein PoB_005568000 [Plakobranchus ocellatus]
MAQWIVNLPLNLLGPFYCSFQSSNLCTALTEGLKARGVLMGTWVGLISEKEVFADVKASFQAKKPRACQDTEITHPDIDLVGATYEGRCQTYRALLSITEPPMTEALCRMV